MARLPTRAGAVGVLALLCLPLLPAACGVGETGRPERKTISQETFVATYVALREAARSSETGEITEEERERVLRGHGVSEDDLLTFVEVHGRRIGFMRDVWNEVEARMEVRDAPGGAGSDTTRPRTPPRPGEEAPGGGPDPA